MSTVYEITAPDGKVYEIEGNGTQEQALAHFKANWKPESNVTMSQPVVEPQFGETGGGAAVGRPTRNLAQVQSEPRPLESALIGGFKGAVVDPILGVSKLFSGGNLGQEASQSMAQQAQPYKEANPYSYLGGNIAGSILPSGAIMKGIGAIPSVAQLPQLGQAVAKLGGTGVLSGLISPEETGRTGQDFYEQQTKQGLLSGAIGTALPMVGRLASMLRGTPQTPQMAEAIQKARDVGYVIPPTQANSTMLNKALEGTSGKLTTAQNASAKNQEVTNRLAAKTLGLPEKTLITPDVLNDIRSTAGLAYENLKLSGTVKTSPKFIQALDNIAPYKDAVQAAKDFPNKAANPIVELVDSLKRPSFDVSSAVSKINTLRNDADKAYRAGDTALGKANKSASQVLENTIENHLASTKQTELLDEFRKARQLIAKTYSVQKALNPSSGTIEASALAAQLKRGKPLSAELKDIANFSLQFPTATKATEKMGSLPQISPLDIALATGVGGATYAGGGENPSMAALSSLLLRPAARSIALSPMVQNRLIQQPNTPNNLANLLMMQGASKALSGE